jgi:hypothetical protein
VPAGPGNPLAISSDFLSQDDFSFVPRRHHFLACEVENTFGSMSDATKPFFPLNLGNSDWSLWEHVARFLDSVCAMEYQYKC